MGHFGRRKKEHFGRLLFFFLFLFFFFFELAGRQMAVCHSSFPQNLNQNLIASCSCCLRKGRKDK